MNNIYNSFYATRRRYEELKNAYNSKLVRDLYEIEKIESINHKNGGFLFIKLLLNIIHRRII